LIPRHSPPSRTTSAYRNQTIIIFYQQTKCVKPVRLNKLKNRPRFIKGRWRLGPPLAAISGTGLAEAFVYIIGEVSVCGWVVEWWDWNQILKYFIFLIDKLFFYPTIINVLVILYDGRNKVYNKVNNRHIILCIYLFYLLYIYHVLL